MAGSSRDSWRRTCSLAFLELDGQNMDLPRVNLITIPASAVGGEG